MKKSLVVSLIFISVSAQILPSFVAQDARYPSVFYSTKRFPTGLFSEDAKTLVMQNQWVIGFDLNDVIFLPDYSRIMAQIKERANDKGIFSLLRTLVKAPTMVVHKAYRKYQQDLEARAWDGYLQYLLTNAQTPEDKEFITFVRTFIQTINTLNFPVIRLAEELQQHGHHTIALTNMGIHFIETQKQLLSEQLKNKRLSEQERISINTLLQLLSDPRSTMPCPEIEWCTKPHPKIYQSFLDKNKEHQGCFAFIDDKEKNVRAAIENGIDIAFVFTSSVELEKALRELGLLPPSLIMKEVFV